MSGVIVLGTQWGDEGKGKIVDALSERAELVVRYQGGANAGHTLIVDGKQTILHLIPSGILRPNIKCIISSGVVADVEALTNEVDGLRNTGFLKSTDQLAISDLVTLILPYHKKLDALREKGLGNQKIGTTGKGIGPAYEDRASRKAILFGDLFDEKKLTEKLHQALLEKNYLIKHYYNESPFSVHDVKEQALFFAEKLAPYRHRDTSLIIHKALKNNKNVLFEGAQGTLLDLWHGTYPYVTSSSTIAGSACVGAGIGPNAINKVIGITKAYTTRVGSGPFPTELFNDIGERLQKEGAEFGATTGRIRRCGWIDLVALKFSMRINGITEIALTKLDVLSGFKEIGVCTRYKLDNNIIDNLPTSPGDLERVEPIIEMHPGWNQSLRKCKTVNELPEKTKSFINFLENKLNVPIGIISVGPDREETIWLDKIF